TGAVKVTPAHDPNDYEMGLRHNLEQVAVIDRFARMTEAAGADFAGLDRYAAREKVVTRLEELGLLEKVVDYEFSISQCERCKTVIEPLISTQWFCRMEELRDTALKLLREKRKPRFVPEVPYEKVYSDWLENLRDWTISRQLWWGHQIPAWYTKDGELIVARSREEAEKKAGTTELKQDEDVLDTWFSSALWPFSTLGWPDETDDLKTFYPTSVLIAARFCLMNAEGADSIADPFGADLPLHDRWILTRLHKTARDVNAQLEQYDFHAAVQTLYHFFWDDFCDWYIELSKATVTAENDSLERSTARARLISVLEQS